MPTNILFINGNPQTEVAASYSLSVAEAFRNAYLQAQPAAEVTELKLYQMQVPLLDVHFLNSVAKLGLEGLTFEQLLPEEQAKMNEIEPLLNQFLEADLIVIHHPVWNFSLPPLLKAYIDLIIIPGKTFTYTSEGLKGLVHDKKLIHIQASGSIFSEGPMAAFDYSDRYIRDIFGMIGVHEVHTIFVEGTATSKVKADEILPRAERRIQEILQKLA